MTSATPLLLSSALATLAAGAAAQPVVDTTGWTCQQCPFEKGTSASVEVGVGASSARSAKYGDYTGIERKGAFLVGGATLRHDDDAGHWARAEATDLGLDTRAVSASGGLAGRYTLWLGYAEIPRHLADGAATPFLGSGSATLRLPAGFPAPDTAAMPLAATLQPVDLGSTRSRFDAGASAASGDAWSHRVTLRRDVRDGSQRTAGSFFSTASQLVVPVDQTTDRIEASTSYRGRRLQATIAYQASLFRNGADALTWANPFTPVVRGSTGGQLALAPANQFHQLSAMAGYDVAAGVRASGEVAFGRGTQDAAYLAPTLNPDLAATLPALPRQSLHGRVDTFNASFRIAVHPLPGLRVNASVARDVRDNRTASDAYPALSTDMFVGAAPRTNQPYSYTQDRVKLSVDYRGPATLKTSAGVEQDNRQRTLQEVQQTRETTLWGRATLQPRSDLALAFKLAHAERTHSTYGVATAVAPPENPLLRKFYLADRSRDSAALRADFNASETVSIGVGVEGSHDDYRHSPLGLQSGRSASLVADVALAVGAETHVHLYGQGEQARSRQAGSQVFGRADWWGDSRDNFTVAGVGVKHVAMKGRLELGADLTASRSRSTTAVDAGVSSPPFPTATTSLDALRLKASYRLKDNLSLHGSFAHESYSAQDWRSAGVLPATVPNLLGFGDAPPHYRINVIQIALRHAF